MSNTREFFDQAPGPVHRMPGVYWDDEQRRIAEHQRAKVEGREPDLDNPPATVSTPRVHAALMANTRKDIEVEPAIVLPVGRQDEQDKDTTSNDTFESDDVEL